MENTILNAEPAMYRTLSILIFTLIFSVPALPQPREFQFQRIDIRKGLSHNQVNCILKDSQGFMWFGTLSGLNRYDGYEFKIFRNDLSDPTSISDNYIERIFELPEGKLLISTRNGLNVYDPATEQFDRNYQQHLQRWSIPAGVPRAVRKNKAGDFLFFTETGLFNYSPGSKKTYPLVIPPSNSGAPPTAVSQFSIDSKENLWLIYRDGTISGFAPASSKRIFYSEALKETNRAELLDYHLFVDAQDELWITVPNNSKGVYYITPKDGRLIHFQKDDRRYPMNSNIVIGNIAQDNKNRIWIGTDHGGINLVDKRDLTVKYLLNDPDDEISLSQNSIYAVYRDNTGIIWLGTYKQGISYFDNSVLFPLVSHRESDPFSLPYEDVNRFAEDEKGNLWIGTNGGGLIYYDRRKEKFQQFTHNPSDPNSLSNDVVVSLCIDHKKRLWIGTYYGGLDCYDGKKFTHYRHSPANPNSIADDRVWEIFEDSKRNLWIGTLNGGLDLFDQERNVFVHHRPADSGFIHSGYISSVLEDKTGRLWVGTAEGIDVLDLKTNASWHFSHNDADPHSLSNDNIIDLLEDSKGRIWIATREGLNLYDRKKNRFTVFRKENGLPDNTILTIVEDAKRNLWLSTPNGLSNLVITEGANGSLNIRYRNFNESDGLQAREFNEYAALRTRAGELVFGGPNGFNIFNPQIISNDTTISPLVLTSLEIFNKTVAVGEKIDGRVLLTQALPYTSELKLHYDQNVFSIQFAALDFSDGQKNRYAYMLEGFSREWLIVNNNQRKATYTNLDPGTYTFWVKSANSDGIWSEKKAVLKIVIMPPFWLTSWAFILYALLTVVAVIVARRIVVQRERMKFMLQEQQKEAERMHALDMMKIRFFTNISHEFRTPITLILSPLEKLLKKTSDSDQLKHLVLMQRNARRLLNLVNQLLDFRRLEVEEFKLNPVEGDIIRFIEETSNSFSDMSEKKNIDYRFNTSVKNFQTFFDRDKLEKILFNLLSNAFKFTPEYGTISLEVHLENDKDGDDSLKMLHISVRDTGIGIPVEKQQKIFERFFQNELPGHIINQGSGIGLAITREFVKLYNGSITVESEPEKGSCFTVVLPVRKTSAETEEAAELPAAPVNGEKSSGTQNGHKRTTVLLVEDNADFRFYLKDNLSGFYNILEASNGKEAWQVVTATPPDLVVSDIMMPEMNGIELSRKIRNNSQTSHIPVILLTAMASEEQQLEGFASGVNDYITKPFNFEILVSRIKNLLAQRRQMRKEFQKQLEVNPSLIAVKSIDEKFMKDALEIVEKNISNADFSVEELSRDLCMSRVALYKKLLALTGKTPIEFIRTIRLKRAAQLLEKSQLTVSEVAYEVGFNNPKYFSRYFKEEFDALPSTYQAKRK